MIEIFNKRKEFHLIFIVIKVKICYNVNGKLPIFLRELKSVDFLYIEGSGNGRDQV